MRTWMVGLLTVLLPTLVLAATPQEELAQQVAEYKKKGELIELEDFAVKGVEEKENAAAALSAAGKLIGADKSKIWERYQAIDELALPLTESEASTIQAVVDAHAESIKLVDEAMTRPKVDWRIKLESPSLAILLPDLSRMRALANLLRHDALLKHQQGDDAAAIADVKRMLFISEKTGQMMFSLVSHIVSRSIGDMAIATIEQIAPDLKIGDGKGEVSKGEVAALMKQLLDDKSVRESMQYALASERMSQYDNAVAIGAKKIDLQKAGWKGITQAEIDAITPEMAAGDSLRMIRRTTATMEAVASSANWSEAKKKLPPLPEELKGAQRRKHIVMAMLTPNLDNAIQKGFVHLSKRRLAAMDLATRLYAAENGGKLPEKLDDLAPKYLAEVPKDVATTGQPFVYMPGGKTPTIFSASEKEVMIRLKRPARKAAKDKAS